MTSHLHCPCHDGATFSRLLHPETFPVEFKTEKKERFMQSLLNNLKTHISELKSEGFFDELQEDMIDPELHTDRFNTQRQNNSRHSRTGRMLEQHRQQMADSIQDALEKLYDGFYYWSHKEINKGQWWGYLGVNYHPAGKYYNMFVQVGCARCRKGSEPVNLLCKPHDLINFLH